jgi:hypothetical protein
MNSVWGGLDLNMAQKDCKVARAYTSAGKALKKAYPSNNGNNMESSDNNIVLG